MGRAQRHHLAQGGEGGFHMNELCERCDNGKPYKKTYSHGILCEECFYELEDHGCEFCLAWPCKCWAIDVMIDEARGRV